MWKWKVSYDMTLISAAWLACSRWPALVSCKVLLSWEKVFLSDKWEGSYLNYNFCLEIILIVVLAAFQKNQKFNYSSSHMCHEHLKIKRERKGVRTMHRNTCKQCTEKHKKTANCIEITRKFLHTTNCLVL